MASIPRRQFLETTLLSAGAWAFQPKWGWGASAKGVETVASPIITGEEATAQPDLWALEVNFKPVRMIYVPLTDPKTGKRAKHLVWYLAYRALVRTSSRVSEALDKNDERPLFVPEFTFVTYESEDYNLVSERDGKPLQYADQVLPEAVEAIKIRERNKNYRSSVDVVGPLPQLTPDKSKLQYSLDGVATWTGIDPDTDFFAVFMTGFSNGYKIDRHPDGEDVVLRRTLVQKFWRPSDRYEQNEEEIRLKYDPYWVYR
ncbi:MAG: hypothetical protein ACKV0T_30180 [Planctomycetales bacterium]